MNFGQFLVHLGHVLGILSGKDPTVTDLTTVDGTLNTRLTTPIIIDTSTLENLGTGSKTPVPPKILSTIFSSTYDSKNRETSVVTGVTAVSEVNMTTGATGSETTVTGETGQTGSETTVTGETGQTGSKTTVTGKTATETTVTGETGTETTVTGETGTETTVTGETGSETTVTGETTVTETTGNETTITGRTGSETTVTGHTGTDPGHTTEAAPTKKLSRGAVAGIVIGCLLLIAVVAAAIVFFVKNRNSPPEAQRLRV